MGEKSGARKIEKWGEKNWGEKSVATFLVPQWDAKSGARKVEREKWSGGKWDEKSGARKVGQE